MGEAGSTSRNKNLDLNISAPSNYFAIQYKKLYYFLRGTMAKPKNPLFGLNVRGTLGKALSFRRRGRETIAEKKPIPTNAKSLAQLSWRHMYQKAVALWHALSPEEREDWESKARSRHMTGFAWFMSQCLKPNPGIYLPLQGGKMQGDIDMAKHKITNLPHPTHDQQAATKKYADEAGLRIATGSYMGDGAGTRQIAVGFKCSMVILCRLDTPQRWTVIPSITIRDSSTEHNAITTDVTLHATDGFVVELWDANRGGKTYYYWAISE